MAYIPYRNDLNNPKCEIIDKVTFSMITTEDVKKIAVVKVRSATTVDPLGHPIPGGLYDPLMGPLTDLCGPCATCNRLLLHCPGHIGYIDLALPVVNPIYHKIVGLIIRITCLQCYHIQIPAHIKHSIVIQMNLLACGFTAEALEVENMIMGLVAQHGSLEQIPEDANLPVKEYEKMAKKHLAKHKGNLSSNKNTEQLRNECISTLFAQVKPRKICMFCKARMNRIQALKNKIIMTTKRIDMSESVDRFNITGRGVTPIEARYINPEESRNYLRQIWIEEKEIMQHIAPVLNAIVADYPTDCFYMDTLTVTPPNCRPVNVIDGRITEHPQTVTYKEIVQNNQMLYVIIRVVKHEGNSEELSLPPEVKAVYDIAPGDSPIEKLNNTWEALQSHIDGLLDRESGRGAAKIYKGFKQMMEKKAGVLRNHVMGKRVNYAARSVIAPDPNLNVDEIGIPEVIAKTLTYPVPVTPWNVTELRKMVLNGPNVHPGACLVEFERGSIVRISPDNIAQREDLQKRLLTPDESREFKGIKKVYRHLENGDVVLVNRQPTLHKPSIMAHKVRILKNEHTVRLHYSNCKSYNADFDGDEMNVHFPQNELGRSEAYNIVNVSNNYLVPKDGSPLGGLIQDHVISGVKLTIRGRFFTKLEYHQLVYQALSFKKGKVITLPPAIIKPEMMWSGKQVISTILINIIPEGKAKINLTGCSKISDKAWVVEEPRPWNGGGTQFSDSRMMGESEIIIRNGELLSGVLDKQHYGATAYGLVHCMYELYGGTCATRLLSSFSKLFTYNLQNEGFTLSVRDLLIVPSAEKKRKRLLKKVGKSGTDVILSTLNLTDDTSLEEVVEKVEEEKFANKRFKTLVDRGYKGVVDKYTNLINKTCLPNGLSCKFPHNNLQLMVQSGAKGSMVNAMQISCLLGQIELEGKRPPVMITGKSLPSFPVYDYSPKAGGFVGGRFLTGIKPREFFFHCMAGREGLIDTAVKTSRSGYLQRCLVKHLEGVKVEYDMTVRDSDKTILQFLYGEDGMDVTKTQFLNENQAKFLVNNSMAILDKDVMKVFKGDEEQGKLKAHNKMMDQWKAKHGDPLEKRKISPFSAFTSHVADAYPGADLAKDRLLKLWKNADPKITDQFREYCLPCPDPLNTVFQPDVHFGALNDRLKNLVDNSGVVGSKKEQKRLKNIIKLKSLQSMAAPGEPVGLLAAQSIGEPSTQMTLNTFHFAGRGEMNVTLGIPRLREILMMASKNISTPSMEIPFLDVPDVETRAIELKKKLTRIVTSNVLEDVIVTYKMQLIPDRQMKYTLKFTFLPPECYSDKYNLKPRHIIKHMTKKFFGQFFAALTKHSKLAKNFIMIEEESGKSKKSKKRSDDDEEADEAEANEDKGNTAENSNNDNEEKKDEDSSDEEPDDPDDAKLGRRKYDQEPEQEEEDAAKSDDEENENAAVATAKGNESEDEDIISGAYGKANNFIYDKKSYSWCELTFGLPLDFSRNLLNQIIRDVAEKSVIRETPNIKNVIITKERIKDKGEEKEILLLKSEGINIPEMFNYYNILDIDKIYCNDIHKIAETYGIEAANRAIVKEVKNVFNVYGIPVDTRHLTLIADYMTSSGSYLPLNRKGMESSASPLQQMSFESALTSLKAAVIRGKRDNLTNPSGCLMLGKLCPSGTGILDTRMRIVQKV